MNIKSIPREVRILVRELAALAVLAMFLVDIWRGELVWAFALAVFVVLDGIDRAARQICEAIAKHGRRYPVIVRKDGAA